MVGLAVCWVVVCYGQFTPYYIDEDPFNTADKIYGPVQEIDLYPAPQTYIKDATGHILSNPVQINKYDRKGHEVEKIAFTEKRFVTTYTSNTSVSVCYTADGTPFEIHRIHRYNEQGKKTLSIDMHGDSVLRMDSIVYNQWGEVAIRYHADRQQPFHIAIAYKYDSVGSLIAMKDMEAGHKFVVKYGEKKHNRQCISVVWTYANGRTQTYCYHYYKGRLTKITDEVTAKTYSDFDKYGNWRRQEIKVVKSGATMVLQRQIEYYTDTDDNY